MRSGVSINQAGNEPMIFDQTFVGDTRNTKEPFAFAISLLFETCGIAVLVLIPLIYVQVLPRVQLNGLLTAPPPPTVPVKTPIEVKTQHVVAVRHFSVLIAPRVVQKQVNTNVQEMRTVPDVATAAFASGATATADKVGDIIGDVLASVPPAPAKHQAATGPLRVATGVAEANLIHKVLPAYPPLARSARIQGTVEFTAIISREGTIENLRLVRGHPLLVQAARDAVLQWRYRPTLLNGQAVQVTTDILVNFTLSQ